MPKNTHTCRRKYALFGIVYAAWQGGEAGEKRGLDNFWTSLRQGLAKARFAAGVSAEADGRAICFLPERSICIFCSIAQSNN